MHFQEKVAFATLGKFKSFQNEEKANNLISFWGCAMWLRCPNSDGMHGTILTLIALREHIRSVEEFLASSIATLTLIWAAIKKSIEWRLQVQIAFLTEVNLAPSRPE
jgi:hypothetical protein